MATHRGQPRREPIGHTMLKMKNLLCLLAVTLLLVMPAQAVTAEESISLRPRWTVDQSASYEFWGKTEKQETATLLGREQSETTVFVSEGAMDWIVDEVNADGSAICTMRLNKVRFSITSGEQEPMVFDSENPTGDQPVFDDLIAAMVKSPLTVRVNADGTIEEVEGIEAMRTAAGQEAQDADIIPEELDFIETASELATLIAAPDVATVGQIWNAKNTWNHESVLPGADTFGDWDTTFTYESRSAIAGVPIATIKASSDIDLKVDLSKLPEGAPDIDIRINDAVGKGEILFDLSRHETVARHDRMSYTADITVSPPTDRVPPITIKVKEISQSQLLRIGEGQKE